MINCGIIFLSVQNENDKRRIGKALPFRSGWQAHDCCHATFDNVAMEIIIAAHDRKWICYHGRGCVLHSIVGESVTLSIHFPGIH